MFDLPEQFLRSDQQVRRPRFHQFQGPEFTYLSDRNANSLNDGLGSGDIKAILGTTAANYHEWPSSIIPATRSTAIAIPKPTIKTTKPGRCVPGTPIAKPCLSNSDLRVLLSPDASIMR